MNKAVAAQDYDDDETTQESKVFGALMEEIVDGKFDIHRQVAVILFEVSDLEVTGKERTQAKSTLWVRLQKGTQEDLAEMIDSKPIAAYLWTAFDQNFPQLAELLK